MKLSSKNTQQTITYSFGKSVFGNYLIANCSQGICWISFFDSSQSTAFNEMKKCFSKSLSDFLLKQAPHVTHRLFGKRIDTFSHAKERVKKEFAALGKIVFLEGTPFQKKVWTKLARVPYGSTITYAQLAKRIGMPRAVRAVANAVASNNIAILIPCHRVVRSNGEIGKFRWGTKLKKSLLDAEH